MIAYTIKRSDGLYYRDYDSILEEHSFTEMLALALILPSAFFLKTIIDKNGLQDCKIIKIKIEECNND